MRDDLVVRGTSSGPPHRPANGGDTDPGFVWQPTGVQQTESDLLHYLNLFWGRRWLLLIVTLLGLAVAAAVSVRQPHLFVAQATVEFKQMLPPGKDLDMLRAQVTVPPALAARLLTTKVLAARAIKNVEGQLPADQADARPGASSLLGVAWREVAGVLSDVLGRGRAMLAGHVEPPAPPRQWEGVDLAAIDAYYASITVQPVRGTSLVDIIVTHPDAEAAARIANTHAQTLIDMDVETKVSSLSEAQGFVGRQLAEAREKLEQSRKQLADYQLAHGILNLPEESSTLTGHTLQQLNGLLTEAHGARVVAEAAHQNARGMTAEQLAMALPDKGLQIVRDQILAAEARYHAQQREYGANHPDMVALRANIGALRRQLVTAAHQRLVGLEAVYEAARAKEDQLRASLDDASRAAGSEDRELVQFSILQREVKSNEEVYASLLEQAKEVDLASGAFQWTNVKLVDRAVAPAAPSYPRTGRNLLLGVLLALFGGLGLCVLVERLDTTIRTPDNLVSVLDLPTFGVIPDFRLLPRATAQAGAAVPEDRALVTLSHPASVIAEAYRSVRTNLLFASPDQPPKSILVTSAQSGEGKTVTVVNLAVALTLSGSRVLVIDADLRKPCCHTLLHQDGTCGLSTVLAGQTPLHDAVVYYPVKLSSGQPAVGPGIALLPAGRIPPNPAELLGSQRMSALLDVVRDQYDFVLIDSPPIVPVTDSVVMATKADGVLLVVRAGEWGRDIVRKARLQLDGVRARVLGAVLNGVDMSRPSDAYYYRRYYGYGSGYGARYGAPYGQGGEA